MERSYNCMVDRQSDVLYQRLLIDFRKNMFYLPVSSNESGKWLISDNTWLKWFRS